jgi:hypothetical protein
VGNLRTKFEKVTEWALMVTAAGVIITSLLIWAKYEIGKTYTRRYVSATAVVVSKDVMHTSPCVKVDVTVKITKDTVILSVGTDNLSGTPVKVADNGTILARQADGRLFAVSKVYTPSLPQTLGNELLILIEPGTIIVFSQRGGCEDIHAFLESQAQSRNQDIQL